MQTIEAIINSQGQVALPEGTRLPAGKKALVTVLDEPCVEVSETALLSEEALGEDWLRPEEDEAWLHLQTEQ